MALPDAKTLLLPLRKRALPATEGLIRPRSEPASSPVLDAGLEVSTTVSLFRMRTFASVFCELRTCAVFGNGVGIGGPGGAGTLQTSGNPKQVPPSLELAGEVAHGRHPSSTRSPSIEVSLDAANACFGGRRAPRSCARVGGGRRRAR